MGERREVILFRYLGVKATHFAGPLWAWGSGANPLSFRLFPSGALPVTLTLTEEKSHRVSPPRGLVPFAHGDEVRLVFVADRLLLQGETFVRR